MTPRDEPLSGQTQELVGLAYLRTVERHADRAWHACHSSQFLAMLARICFEYEVQPLSDGLIRGLSAVYEDPHDEYVLIASVAASMVWQRGGAASLLMALNTSTMTRRRSTTGLSHGRVRRRPTRVVILTRSRPPHAPGGGNCA